MFLEISNQYPVFSCLVICYVFEEAGRMHHKGSQRVFIFPYCTHSSFFRLRKVILLCLYSHWKGISMQIYMRLPNLFICSIYSLAIHAYFFWIFLVYTNELFLWLFTSYGSTPLYFPLIVLSLFNIKNSRKHQNSHYKWLKKWKKKFVTVTYQTNADQENTEMVKMTILIKMIEMVSLTE